MIQQIIGSILVGFAVVDLAFATTIDNYFLYFIFGYFLARGICLIINTWVEIIKGR